MRFFVLQPKHKNDETRKRGVRRGLVVLILAIFFATSLFLLFALRFRPMSDVPSHSLIYSVTGKHKTQILDFQSAEHHLISLETTVSDTRFLSNDHQAIGWFCINLECNPLQLVYGSELESLETWTVLGSPVYGTRQNSRIDWSLDGEWITYTASGDEASLAEVNKDDLEVWIIHVQTEEIVRVTSDNIRDKDPSFSPDNTQVVYISGTEGNEKIVTTEIATGVSRTIADVPYASNPCWSPDGEWIAFEVPFPDKPAFYKQISLIRIDGTHLQSVTLEPTELIGWDRDVLKSPEGDP